MPASKKAEETRSRILRAALDLFRSRGFDETTMREIAKARPTSLGDLRGVTGVGEKKLETYGAEIVALIQAME